ncbi:MAG TPA: hypothetical protein VI248_18260 [Kineosporiaceae bacterium]
MPFKITKLFHLIHVTEDYAGLDAWYEEVFGAIRFTDGRDGFPYLDVEKRNATLTTVASACIEPISPAFQAEGWEQAPIGKFYNKFGTHWYSLAWHLDDPLDLYRHLKDQGVRFFGQGGASGEPSADDPLFTHPKDTVCALEFLDHRSSLLATLPDPRFVDPDYSAIDWSARTPLGLQDLGYVTVVTKDLDRGRTVFADWLRGTVLGASTSELTGTQDLYVQVGESVIQLSKPVDDLSLASTDLAKNGESMHSVAWRVADLAKAKEFLTEKSVKFLAEDEHTLLADPATTFGACYRFTDLGADQLATR